jgi:hypothetical protein
LKDSKKQKRGEARENRRKQEKIGKSKREEGAKERIRL